MTWSLAAHPQYAKLNGVTGLHVKEWLFCAHVRALNPMIGEVNFLGVKTKGCSNPFEKEMLQMASICSPLQSPSLPFLIKGCEKSGFWNKVRCMDKTRKFNLIYRDVTK